MQQAQLERLVRENNGKIAEFHYSQYGLKVMPGLEKGQCLAFSLLYLSKKSGSQLVGGGGSLHAQYQSIPDGRAINEADLTAHCSKIMTQQKSLELHFSKIKDSYKRFVEWMKEIGPSYELKYKASDTSGGDQKTGLASGVIARFVLAKKGRYIIGMSGVVSHAISALNGGESVFFFDPNFGIMVIPVSEFEDFCLDYFFEMNKSGAYKYQDSVMVRFEL